MRLETVILTRNRSFESGSLQQRVMQTIGSSTLLGSTAAEDCEAAQNPRRGLAADPCRGLNVTPDDRIEPALLGMLVEHSEVVEHRHHRPRG